jgi:hypothetical protein
MAVLTLLTDYGLADYYVAAVKGTVLRLAPAAVLVDVSHEVAFGDIEGAAFLLAAVAPAFPAGTVHLVVVDPGVGSERRMLVAKTRTAFFVAPDNGLLTAVLAEAEVRSAERPDLYLDSPSRTFDGRDRFAPLAAALLRGEDFTTLGPVITDAVRLDWTMPRREGDTSYGTVRHVDRFGSLVTDIPSSWLPAGRLHAAVGSRAANARANTYAAMRDGEPTLVPGSMGTVELSLRGESLAALWRLGRGTAVRVEPVTR